LSQHTASEDDVSLELEIFLLELVTPNPNKLNNKLVIKMAVRPVIHPAFSIVLPIPFFMKMVATQPRIARTVKNANASQRPVKIATIRKSNVEIAQGIIPKKFNLLLFIKIPPGNA